MLVFVMKIKKLYYLDYKESLLVTSFYSHEFFFILVDYQIGL